MLDDETHELLSAVDQIVAGPDVFTKAQLIDKLVTACTLISSLRVENLISANIDRSLRLAVLRDMDVWPAD